MSSNEILGIKMKQIASLKSRFSNAIELSKDSTFKIPLSNILSLLISLPVNFPTNGPSFFIEGFNNHLLLPIPNHLATWTTMTNLSNLTFDMYKYINSDGRILKDYESRLSSSNSPPPPYNGNNISNSGGINISGQPTLKDMSGSGGGSSTNLNSNTSSTGSNGAPQPPPYKDNLPSFKIPSSFPDLMNKSKEELEEFLSNEDMLNAYLFSFDQISIMSEEKDKLIKQGEDLLVEAEQLQKQYDESKSNHESKTKLYQELKDEYNRLNITKESIDNENSHSALMERLSDLIVKSEIETDNLTNAFNDGTIELKEFRKKFKETRMQYHSRCSIKEKQQQLLH